MGNCHNEVVSFGSIVIRCLVRLCTEIILNNCIKHKSKRTDEKGIY